MFLVNGRGYESWERELKSKLNMPSKQEIGKEKE
jgi:hypothetical protein